MKWIKRSQLIAINLAAFALILVLPYARAATIIVSSTTDSGSGTLREALASAADGDTIDATGVSGTITLLNGELVVSTVSPSSAPAQPSGDRRQRRQSRVRVQNGVITSIASLTITNGLASGSFPTNAGGGIYNDHSVLTISNCTLSATQVLIAAGS